MANTAISLLHLSHFLVDGNYMYTLNYHIELKGWKPELDEHGNLKFTREALSMPGFYEEPMENGMPRSINETDYWKLYVTRDGYYNHKSFDGEIFCREARQQFGTVTPKDKYYVLVRIVDINEPEPSLKTKDHTVVNYDDADEEGAGGGGIA